MTLSDADRTAIEDPVERLLDLLPGSLGDDREIMAAAFAVYNAGRSEALAALSDAEAERDAALALIPALDDWFDSRGGNPRAALQEAVRRYRSDYRQRTGRWYDAELVRVLHRERRPAEEGG